MNDLLKPKHAPLELFQTVAGELAIGGVPLMRLAARVGRTPFYAYDRHLISERVASLRRSLPPGVELHYAIKANPMPAVVCHLASLVDGFDVASGQELRIALDADTAPQHISFAGPGKSRGELAQAVAAGVTINIESANELEAIGELGRGSTIRPRVALRVNPSFELKAAGMKMGGAARAFGMDEDQVPALLSRLAELGLEFLGFHIFAGSQILNAAALVEMQRQAIALAARLAAHAPGAVRTLNIGGGFGIPYFPGEKPLDLAEIAAGMAGVLAERDRLLPGARIVIELGRYIVGEAGVYVCRIIDRKTSKGQVFLVTDGGLHHHLAATGNFGQVLRKNYPIAVGNRMDANRTEIATVTGPLCTPLDVLAERVKLPASEIGDLVVVFQSGAYGLTASPTMFLSHPPPIEVLV